MYTSNRPAGVSVLAFAVTPSGNDIPLPSLATSLLSFPPLPSPPTTARATHPSARGKCSVTYHRCVTRRRAAINVLCAALPPCITVCVAVRYSRCGHGAPCTLHLLAEDDVAKASPPAESTARTSRSVLCCGERLCESERSIRGSDAHATTRPAVGANVPRFKLHAKPRPKPKPKLGPTRSVHSTEQ